MNTTTTRTVRAGRVRIATVAVMAAVALGTASCSGSISHNYRSFQSALDRGANCRELFDQRGRFENEDTLAKVDRDLAEIGCHTPESTRTDR
jgi:hypothetical protein